MNDLEMLIQMLDTVKMYTRSGDARLIRLELYPDRSGSFKEGESTIFSWGEGFRHLFENYSLWVAREMKQR